jgi:septal ring factor EnvC (AmiA/AmiB activator)
MMILGLLLVLVSAAGTALLISYNHSGGPEQTIVMFGRDWFSVTPLQAFIAGLAIALVFCLGVWMVASTERRRRATRSEYRAVRREARTAARERDQLARELADRDERIAEAPTPPAGTERPAAWTAPQRDERVAEHGETTETQGPAPAEPRGRFGRHFRRSERTAEHETPASSGPAQ